eukprot:COSAG02_NODE_25314_length_662_cov_0.989343_1_plen_75_part_10
MSTVRSLAPCSPLRRAGSREGPRPGALCLRSRSGNANGGRGGGILRGESLTRGGLTASSKLTPLSTDQEHRALGS